MFSKTKQHFSFYQTSFNIPVSSSVASGSTVVHLNFHCMHDYVIELRHKIYVNNLNVGMHWTPRAPTAVETDMFEAIAGTTR